MRIAYLTQSYPPMISGAALVVENLAKAMAGRGHQVLVIAASDQRQTYVVQEDNLTVLRLKSWHNPLRVGQRFLLFPRRSVMQALRNFQPDTIHIHEPVQMGLLGSRYARPKRIPITLTIHQLPSFAASYLPGFLYTPVEAILRIFAHRLSRNFTSFIAPTETTSRKAGTILRCSLNTISNGVDLQMFHPTLSHHEEMVTRQTWDLPLDVPLLLHVGRLDPDKHVDRVIQAAAITMRENNAHLLVIGDGIQKPTLVKLCRSLGIAERVHFTGYISASQGLPEIYRSAYLFITTSEVETQGIVLLEAAASGLPIVAMDTTCIPEIVHDGINGLLTKPGDLNGLGNAMSLLLQDPSAAMRMGQASRKLAEGHDIRYTMDAHEGLYRQQVQANGSLSNSWRPHPLRKHLSTWRSFIK